MTGELLFFPFFKGERDERLKGGCLPFGNAIHAPCPPLALAIKAPCGHQGRLILDSCSWRGIPGHLSAATELPCGDDVGPRAPEAEQGNRSLAVACDAGPFLLCLLRSRIKKMRGIFSAPRIFRRSKEGGSATQHFSAAVGCEA